MSEILLPKQKVKAVSKSPNLLIIFSKPKIGKTSLFAELESSLILDFEKGSQFVDAVKIEIESIDQLTEIGKQIKAEGYPYKYGIVDTMTALEELCIPYAEVLYSRKLQGKNWFKTDADGKLAKDSGKVQYGNILNLPNGSGYGVLREAVTKVVDFIKSLFPRTILSCHIKDVLLEKAGSEFTSSDLDLIGKTKRILSSQSDAIGYLYRKGNENILSFATSDAVSCGARPEHLRNAEIVVSEMTEKGLITHWDRIFID
jgi:hypothetical protein